MSMLLNKFKNLCKYKNRAVFLHYRQLEHASVKPILRQKTKSTIGVTGWLLLAIPTSTFALGTWQVKRKKWKENLMAELYARTSSHPIELPRSVEEINELEYYPVHVRGTFLHEKEIYLGPRSLIVSGKSANESRLISKGQEGTQGYFVVTPFKLADRPQTILVNRGWVPKSKKNPSARQEGQVKGEVDLVGLIRLHENRPNFMPPNKPDANVWFYRDLEQMCEVTGANPVFLDATTDFEFPGGPVGGQTRISLRNEHLSYIITWYSLSAATSFMWYKHFIKGLK